MFSHFIELKISDTYRFDFSYINPDPGEIATLDTLDADILTITGTELQFNPNTNEGEIASVDIYNNSGEYLDTVFFRALPAGVASGTVFGNTIEVDLHPLEIETFVYADAGTTVYIKDAADNILVQATNTGSDGYVRMPFVSATQIQLMRTNGGIIEQGDLDLRKTKVVNKDPLRFSSAGTITRPPHTLLTDLNPQNIILLGSALDTPVPEVVDNLYITWPQVTSANFYKIYRNYVLVATQSTNRYFFDLNFSGVASFTVKAVSSVSSSLTSNYVLITGTGTTTRRPTTTTTTAAPSGFGIAPWGTGSWGN
jgi:hypothetical protein